MSAGNRENLVKLEKGTQRTREIVKASAAARKRKAAMKKDFKRVFQNLLDADLPACFDSDDIVKVTKGSLTTREAIAWKMADKAIKGDTKAAEFVRDTAGESPKQQVELSNDEPFSININIVD